jgi:SAM-dependent methyltransferase
MSLQKRWIMTISAIKNGLVVIREVFGDQQKLPGLLPSFVMSYLSLQEMTILATYLDRSKFRVQDINLVDPRVLKLYLRKIYQDEKWLKVATTIAQEAYQGGCPRRLLLTEGNTNFGVGFPMDSEVVAYLMQRAQGKRVVELGGASGQIVTLLVLAGAFAGYLNDIEPKEVAQFEANKKLLPPAAAQRLISIPGDCLTILEKKPALANKIDILVCRNLLHFLDQDQQNALFKMMKKMLKPGGEAVFTVNSIYSMRNGGRAIFEENQGTTCFLSRSFKMTDYDHPDEISYDLERAIWPCPEERFNLSEASNITLSETQAGSWKWNTKALSELDALDSSIQQQLPRILKENDGVIKKVKRGIIRFLSSYIHVYQKSTLTALFERHGFEVGCTFVVSSEGHLVHDADVNERGHQIGILVRRPLQKA